MNGALTITNLDPDPDAIPIEVQRTSGLQRVVSYDEWKLVDAEEQRRGEELGGKERERMEWNEVVRFLDHRAS